MTFLDRLIGAVRAYRSPPSPRDTPTIDTLQIKTSMDLAEELEKERYAGFLAYRREMTELEWDQSKSFDQALITVSGGALVLSITFIDSIAPTPEHVWLLYPAWIGLGVALISTLLSFHFGKHAAARARAIEDRRYEGEIDPCKLRNRWVGWSNRLNWIAIATFLVGISCLAAFSLINVSDDLSTEEEVVPYGQTRTERFHSA
jgi:hypothetical protein